MQLADALRIVNEGRQRKGPELRVGLACGFSPHHMQTFLRAVLLERFPERRVTIETGLYGDLAGNLQRLERLKPDAVAVAIEWSDLDPRLGFRGSHGWRADLLPDILATANESADRLGGMLLELAKTCVVAVTLPQLPFPPAFPPAIDQGMSIGFSLQARVASLADELCRQSTIRVLQPTALQIDSPVADVFDLKSELASGFPYSVAHAADLSGRLARLMFPPPTKKGIITDLDDTLWRGILGEDGIDGLSWHLDRNTHAHAIYQELLASLGEAGVLLAAATKNDPQLTAEALRHEELILPGERLFPVEAHWGPKSESVGRILDAWNVSADSVVFVDDSPRELAEVQAAFPDITTLRFPSGNDRQVLGLLRRLRDLCGKPSITEEDRIRAESIRRKPSLASQSVDPGSTERFHRQSESEITIAWDRPDERCFELINKTNQFNLNGRRIEEADWRRRLESEGQFLLTVAYRDKFGPLGKIAAVCGHVAGAEARVDVWVMSCRAFSRFIEHQTVQQLFARLPVDTLRLDYVSTERNGPIGEFLRSFSAGSPAGEDGTRIERSEFTTACPESFSTVITK